MDLTVEQAVRRRDEALRAIRARRWNRVLSEAFAWPAGVLQTCDRLEDEHPGWLLAWLNENTIKGFERPAGFRAVRVAFPQRECFDPDPAELVKQMD